MVLICGHGEQAEQQAVDNAKILQVIAEDSFSPGWWCNQGTSRGLRRIMPIQQMPTNIPENKPTANNGGMS
jgi:hypothetical protein